ncbi:MAG TPA: response regulator, partial [Chloroflexota bacterium]|nr:response regulator [Chloroflexota bacterium]
MSAQPLKVLLVEDNPADADLIEEALLDAAAGSTFQLVSASRLQAGLERLAGGDIAVVLLDLSLPDSHGFETFTRMRTHIPSVPIVVMSGLDDQALADRAVREGAQDYLVKGQVDGNLLVRSLRYAIERKRAEEEREHLIREQAARAQATFLAEASKQLATSLDVEDILRNVARLAVPTLADACLVDTLDDGDMVKRIAVAWVGLDGQVVNRATEHRYQLDPRASHPAAEALHSGAPRVLDGFAGVWLEGLATDEHARPQSVMVVPLMARGRALGALTFLYTTSGRWYGEGDVALAEDLATRAALAMDNARLYTELQQQLRARDEFLAAASHDLKNPLTS